MLVALEQAQGWGLLWTSWLPLLVVVLGRFRAEEFEPPTYWLCDPDLLCVSPLVRDMGWYCSPRCEKARNMCWNILLLCLLLSSLSSYLFSFLLCQMLPSLYLVLP